MKSKYMVDYLYMHTYLVAWDKVNGRHESCELLSKCYIALRVPCDYTTVLKETLKSSESNVS